MKSAGRTRAAPAKGMSNEAPILKRQARRDGHKAQTRRSRYRQRPTPKSMAIVGYGGDILCGECGGWLSGRTTIAGDGFAIGPCGCSGLNCASKTKPEG